MKTFSKLAAVVCGICGLFLLAACDGGWVLDYGKPVAQFNEASVLKHGPEYVSKKITVKGVVTKKDLSDPANCLIYLGHGITCNFGRMKEMAESYEVGETIYVDGILKRCVEGDILLTPAVARDPGAGFDPVE